MGNDDEIKDGSSGPRRRRTRRTPGSEQPDAGGQEASQGEVEDTRELTVRSRNLFLRDVQTQLAQKELYDLDDEFAKTKQNRSPVVPVSVGLFVVIMLAAGIAVTTYIQQRSQNVPVNIASFQDVNLMELLDRAKQISDQLATAEQELQTTEQNQSDEISAAKAKEAQEIQIINNESISAAEQKSKIDSVRAQTDYQIKQIQAKYAPQIKKEKEKVASLQNQAAKYDTRQVQQAKKQEAVLNNQQKLFDMQMQKTETFYKDKITTLTNQYKAQIASINQHNTQLVALMKKNQADQIASLIAKYNPTFTSPELVALLNAPVSSDPVSRVTEDPFVRLAEQAGEVNASQVTALQSRINDFGVMIGALRKVPYENSIPPALAHLQSYDSQIIASYRAIGKGLNSIVTQKNQQIAQLQQRVSKDSGIIAEYQHALSSLVRNSRENGYVLDPQNPSRIAVFIDPLYHVKTGDTGYVFRRDDQPIGTIRFTVKNGEITADEISLVKKDVPMQPFDKILLKLN